MLERGPGQVDPYPPLEPAPWWSVLEPFSPLDVLILAVLVVAAVTYLAGVAITLWRTVREMRAGVRLRARARAQPRGAPYRVAAPSWFTLVVMVPWGLLLAALWPGLKAAHWALAEPD